MIKSYPIQSKTPTALIVGKKIVPEQPVFYYDDDKPPPFQIFAKRKKVEKSPPANDSKVSRKKLKSVSNRLPPKAPEKENKKQLQKPAIPRSIKPPLNKSFQKTKVAKKENIKEIEKPITSNKSASPNIDSIIKRSLKKEMRKKIKRLKEKRGLEEIKQMKKQEIIARDQQIREDNSRVKKVKFNPKYNWGVDQSRLQDRRRSEKDMPRRPKSSERVRTCLDTIKEIQMELGVSHFRSRSLSNKPDNSINIPKHSSNQNDRSMVNISQVRAFMKKQDLCRKQQKIYENLQKFAEESRRRAQLQKLQSAAKAKKKAKKVKKAKKKLFKKPYKFVIKEESLEDQKSLSFVYDTNRKESENLDLKIPDMSKISKYSEYIKSSDSEFYKSSEDVFNAEEEELKYYAASKIQACIRGFLVRRRMMREEDFDSIDDQVKHITEGIKDNKPGKKPKGLKIDLPSEESNEFSYIDSHDDGSSEKSYQIQPVPNAEDELKRQVIWREAQVISLESLRKKEIRDMQIIAGKVGKADELEDMLSSMIGKRYDQISELFQQNLKEVKSKLEEDLNTDEREELNENLDEKREEFSRLIEVEGSEDFGQDLDFAESDEFSLENRPVIYQPKSQDLKLCLEQQGKRIEYRSDDYDDDQDEQDYFEGKQSHSETSKESDSEQSEQENQFDTSYNSQSEILVQEQDAIFDDKLGKVSLNFKGISMLDDYNSGSDHDYSDDTEGKEESEVEEMKQISILNPSPQMPNRKFIRPETSSEETSIDLKKDSYILANVPEGPSHTPDYIPTRPQAPLEYFPGEHIESSPEMQTSVNDERPDLVLPPEIDLTPELVNSLADSILFTIVDSINFSEFKKLAPFNIENSPSSSSSESFHIQTDAISIRAYVEEIFLRSDLNDLQERLKVPLRKKALDVLAKMQEIEIGTMTEAEVFVFPDILRVDLYIDIENNRETQTSASSNMNQLAIEAEHIHNKMIFDATNEALQKFRPYGLQGVPMPWSNRKQWIGNGKVINKVIVEVTENIVEGSQVQAGKISNDEMLMSNGILDEELLQQVREERLASMLADEIIEKDELWTNYEFEETQVKLDLADMILELLAEETLKILEKE